MGLVLLCVIWLITFASTYFFVAKTWWFPHGASAATAALDHQFAVTLVLMGVIFVAAQLALGYFVWRYRDQPSAARDPLHRVELDGESHLGGGTFSPGGGRGYAGRGHGHAVRLVFPLSRSRWQVWNRQAGVGRPIRRRGSGLGPGPGGSVVEGRRCDGHYGSACRP